MQPAASPQPSPTAAAPAPSDISSPESSPPLPQLPLDSPTTPWPWDLQSSFARSELLSPIPQPSPTVICEPLLLPERLALLLETECSISNDNAPRVRVEVSTLSSLCTYTQCRDAVSLAEDSGCQFVSMRTVVSVATVGYRADPQRCKVMVGAENHFCQDPSLFSLRIKPMNLSMASYPEDIIFVDVPITFQDESFVTCEVEMALLWRIDELAALCDSMSQSEQDAIAQDSPVGKLHPRHKSWWVPLADTSEAVTHCIRRPVMVIVTRLPGVSTTTRPDEDVGFVRVRMIEPRLVELYDPCDVGSLQPRDLFDVKGMQGALDEDTPQEKLPVASTPVSGTGSSSQAVPGAADKSTTCSTL